MLAPRDLGLLQVERVRELLKSLSLEAALGVSLGNGCVVNRVDHINLRSHGEQHSWKPHTHISQSQSVYSSLFSEPFYKLPVRGHTRGQNDSRFKTLTSEVFISQGSAYLDLQLWGFYQSLTFNSEVSGPSTLRFLSVKVQPTLTFNSEVSISQGSAYLDLQLWGFYQSRFSLTLDLDLQLWGFYQSRFSLPWPSTLDLDLQLVSISQGSAYCLPWPSTLRFLSVQVQPTLTFNSEVSISQGSTFNSVSISQGSPWPSTLSIRPSTRSAYLDLQLVWDEAPVELRAGKNEGPRVHVVGLLVEVVHLSQHFLVVVDLVCTCTDQHNLWLSLPTTIHPPPFLHNCGIYNTQYSRFQIMSVWFCDVSLSLYD